MIPSFRWFPSKLQDRAAWFQHFATQMTALGGGLGFTPAEIAAVNTDNAALQFLAATAIQAESYTKALSAYRKLVLEGKDGKPGGELPQPPVYPPTPPVAAQGIFERLARIVQRIRVAPGYTAETGAAFGIIPAAESSAIADSDKPNPSLRALPGNVVEIVFTRGRTDGIYVQIQIDNSGIWENAGRFARSPAEMIIPQNAAATARSVQVRARYLKGNNAVGQYSDIDAISTTP